MRATDQRDDPMTRAGARECRGFTVIDLMVALIIIVVLTVLVAPRLNDESALRVRAAAAMLRSDLELAQVMTIANPQHPVAVRFDENDGYTLLDLASGDPIPRADGQGYVVVFGQGRAAAAARVTWSGQDMPEGHLAFNEFGGLADPDLDPVITLACGPHWVRFTFNATTGTIEESSG